MTDPHGNGIRPVWIASYPRSGNTFLRIILQNIFRQPTYSIYRIAGQDFPDPSADALEEAPFLPVNWRQLLTQEPGAQPFFIKTHDAPEDDSPAIYLVRDGRAAIDSYFHYQQKFAFEHPSLTAVIAGACQFGGWSEHYRAWQPLTRPRTLFLQYERMVSNPAAVIPQIAGFLQLEPAAEKLPTFDELQARFPAFFRRGQSDEFLKEWSPSQKALFNECHGPVMRELGYELSETAGTAAGLVIELAHTAAESHKLYLKNLATLGATAALQQQLHVQNDRLSQEVSRLSQEARNLSARLAQADLVQRNAWVRLGRSLRVVPQELRTNGH